MTVEYQSGTYCNEIQCEHAGVLLSLNGEEYFVEKHNLCKDCNAWDFFNWLKVKNFSIKKSMDTMESLPDRRFGEFMHLKAEDFTDEELSAIRSFYI